jgi:hypothetical protein
MDQDWISQYYGDLPDDKSKKEEPAPKNPPQPEPPPQKSSEQKPKTEVSSKKKENPPPKKSSKKLIKDTLLLWIIEQAELREEERLAKERAREPQVHETIRVALEKSKEIDKRLGEILSQSGFTGQSLKDYLSNPNNFTQQQWKFVNNYRMTMQNKLKSIMGGKPLPEIKKKSDPKKKSIGSRKHWLDMR